MIVLSNFVLKENPKSMFLEEKLMNAREEMYELAKAYGITHGLTVAKSQELDIILNNINHLKLVEKV